jgi:tetratricopeptide (TPR) repeat protein
LCRLALDPDFKQAQTQHLPDEPNLPLKTVQLALDAAIQLEDAPMMARLLIEHAKRAQSEAETPLQAWRKGHRERALRVATEIVFERDHKLGTLWSLFLAWVAESEGEQEWSKCFLNEVRKRWEGAKLEEFEYWQGEMAAFLLGELGQVEGAIKVVRLALNNERKRDLATRWALKRLFERALRVTEEIHWTDEQARALSAISGEMAKARMFDQALKVVEEIENAGEQAKALSVIAEEMSRARMFDQALKVVEGIEDAWWRAKALVAIAVEMARTGKEEQAKEVFDQALQVAERIWVVYQIDALRTIAVGMSKARMFDQALKVVERIVLASEERARALSAIAIEMAKARMFDQALQVMGRVEDAWWQAWALSVIAEEIAKIGMVEQTKEVFDRALQVAKRIENTFRQAEVLGAISGEMAKARMFDQALKVVEEIENAGEQAKALSVIAEEMSRARMFDQALKVVEGIEDAWWRAKALVVVAVEMAKAGMFDQALKVVEEVEEERWVEALVAIAVEMAETGMVEQAKEVFDQALKVVEEIENAWQRAKALEAIAKEMVKAGEVEGAVGIVKRATGIRTEVLPSILEALAERASEEDGKSKEGFLRLLPLCGWSLELAYRACGWLARLYHEQGEVIELISNLSEQWQWSHTPEILRGRSDSHHRMSNRFWGTVCQVVWGAVEHFFGWFKRAIRSREHNC